MDPPPHYVLWRAGDRGRRTEDGGQKTEDRRQKFDRLPHQPVNGLLAMTGACHKIWSHTIAVELKKI